jgi:hypothetical protein
MPDQEEPTTTPPAALSPPTIDPARWEDFPTFRESLLRHCTGPEANAAMRAFGMLLFEMVLEWNGTQPGAPEGYIRHDVRAALADLRAAEGFLAYIGAELEDLDEGDPEDAAEVRLCKLAAKLARKVAKIGAAIEGALSEPAESR